MLPLRKKSIEQQTVAWKRPSSFILGLCTMLCIVFFADSIWATENSGTIENNPTGYKLSTGEHFINAKEGIVKGGPYTAPIVVIDASTSGSDAIIENYGLIHSENIHGLKAVNLTDGTLKNYGTITAKGYMGMPTIYPNIVYVTNGTVYNYGKIEELPESAPSTGVVLHDSTLHNQGTINVSSAIFAAGNSKVYLETGTNITGSVTTDSSGLAELYLADSGTVNFEISSKWKFLQKTGAGIWVIDKDINANFGSVSIHQGTLALGNGSFGDSIKNTLTLHSGATLDLGTNELEAPNSIFMPNSTIKVTLTSNEHGLLTGDNVTMGENVVILPTIKDTVTNELYTLIIANEASSYAGATLSNKKDKISCLFSSYELIKGNDSLKLKVAPVSDEYLVQQGINTTDVHAIKTAFKNDNVSMGKLASLSIEKAKKALKEAHAEPIAEVISAVRDAGYAAQGVITKRLLTTRSVALSANEQTGLSSGSDEVSWKIWGQGFGSVSSETAHNDSNGYDANTTGLTFGVDKALVENFRLGLAYSYIYTDVDSKSSSNNNEVDSNLLTVYCEKLFGDDMYLDAHISYGFNNYKAKRYMTELGLQAKADFDGSTFNLGGEFGKSFNFTSNPITITPYIGLAYSYISIDSYKESGAGSSNLIVDDTYNNVFTSTLGARFGATFNAFKPEMHAAWVHDWAQEEISTNAEFANSGAALSSSAVSNDPDKINLGMGLGWQVSDVVTLDLTADYLGSAHMDSWGGTVKMSYEF
ncbi:autotransporter outer membrane beta-barrel domain-containing protein [Halodesulfovibrio aestuarii]|uniref:autotransporter family protein n=1 Tax=Halodesulfovibrio aestuarii TaxID=126333 RepID=UPI00041CF678